MHRFFVEFPLPIDPILTDRNIVHQITRVLRMHPGQEIILFDGDGSEILYEITDITKTTISLRGKNRRFPKTEPIKTIILYQAIPNKIEKIEYILQKGVEVGISGFVFFRSDYSQKVSISESKKSRFYSIIKEALEQCGGLIMPEIQFIDNIWDKEFLFSNIVLDTRGISRKISEISILDNMNIWVGPEGGWSENERKKMEENGFIFVHFGERILRTETAGIVTAFSFLYG